MNGRLPAIAVVSIALLLPAQTYSIITLGPGTGESSERPLLTREDFAPLTAPQIIEKLEAHIAGQQTIINAPKTKQARDFIQKIAADVAALAVDKDSGKVLNQKLLDLLSSQGISVTTKDGKVINPSKDPGRASIESQESLPQIGIPENATPEEKAKINDLLQASKALVQQVVDAKRALPNLQAIAVGLYQLSDKDPDARKMVEKYNIKYAPAPPPSPGPR